MRPDFGEVERRAGGRLGVFALDLGSGAQLSHRSGERFPMCSTFKALLAGCVLSRVDAGREQLDLAVRFGRADLLPISPVAELRLRSGAATVGELCDAILVHSDNTAANLLLARVGGPAGLTRWLRGIGDRVTRLDRPEPQMNEARLGDVRDTTTPAAVVDTWRKLLFGPVLRPASKARLLYGLEGSLRGLARLRAGLPRGWRAGDRPGTNTRGVANDVAVVFPPGRKPWLIAAFLTASPAALPQREGALADVGRLVAAEFARG